MKEVTLSEFKTKCLTLLAEVEKTKKAIRITREGSPVAEILPVATHVQSKDWIGSMKDRIQILGDIVSPANDETDWEVLND